MEVIKKGRKIPVMYDNPIDNVLLDYVDICNPYFYRLKCTPNTLTTFSACYGVLCVWCLYKGFMISAGIHLFISYFFDCADGNFARRYKMITKYGDYYDHIKDCTVMTLFYIVFLFQNKVPINLYLRILLLLKWLVLFNISFAYLGYQEMIYNKPEYSNTLSLITKYCKGNAKKQLKVYRWFGTGSVYAIISLTLITLGIAYY